MKHFSGLSIGGPEVAWRLVLVTPWRYGWAPLPTGRIVSGGVEPMADFAGDTGGLSQIKVAGHDAKNRLLYKSAGGFSFTGNQAVVEMDGRKSYSDTWTPMPTYSEIMQTAEGPVEFLVDSFSSGYVEYLSSIGSGLYMERKAVKEGVARPLTITTDTKSYRLWGMVTGTKRPLDYSPYEWETEEIEEYVEPPPWYYRK